MMGALFKETYLFKEYKMINTTLHEVTEKEKNIFNNLNQLFAYDFSELNKMDINDDGLYQPLQDVEDYYTKSEYSSFFIKVEGKLAGLAVIKFISEENVNYLRHFFIMRKYRRLKVGEMAVNIIFDRFSGKWRVSQFDYNEPAICFWRKVIERYTKGKYIETRRIDKKGFQQEFIS
jgi:predicted acetyltransferase